MPLSPSMMNYSRARREPAAAGSRIKMFEKKNENENKNKNIFIKNPSSLTDHTVICRFGSIYLEAQLYFVPDCAM